ncbi:hypothetical protein AYK26_01855 [Euryarchaeota archaeon SM23-78]|nr:MAG: hypothetical protein AYK26_01855 [Euryarchaeota archaeon SM23-78]MBW3000338.1 hypothetical protein [Candidatus Woesearchaeota archaeon]
MKLLNKKGILQAIEDIGFAIIVIFIAILLMGLLTKVNEQNNINEGKIFMEQALSDNLVALYLKQPVDVHGDILTMADLTVLAYESKSIYKDWWTSETNRIFMSSFGYESEGNYRICVREHGSDACKLVAGRMSVTMPTHQQVFHAKWGTSLSPNKLPDSVFNLPSYSGKGLYVLIYVKKQ